MRMPTRKLRACAQAASGFTLIEILLAIGILALGITAVLFLFTMGARAHKRAIDRTQAALLAETVANLWQERLTADAAPVDVPKATHPDFPGFYYSVAFTQLPENAHYYQVSIVVRWGDESAPPEPRNSETYRTVLEQKSF